MSSAFSLFEWLQEKANAQDVPTRLLTPAPSRERPVAGQRFTAGVQVMLHWCQANERLVLEQHAEGSRVVAGFERYSRVRPALSRYRQLSRSVRSLTIFGYPDVPLLLDANIVSVPEKHPLAREWFLVIDAPQYTALIAARDLSGFGPTGPLVQRQFSGIALHDSKLVREACDKLAAEAEQLASSFA